MIVHLLNIFDTGCEEIMQRGDCFFVGCCRVQLNQVLTVAEPSGVPIIFVDFIDQALCDKA